MISSTFDLTVLVTVVFISYIGGTSHKPKWLGAGVFIQGIGALLFASPQFIAGDYDVGKDANLSFEACKDKNDFSPDCRKSDNIYFMFILANIVIGVGSTPLFTVGTSYIDDIVHPKRAPIWLGIFYTLAVIGPALGFGIGGGFLNIFVDPWKETTLKKSDPGWVGAWWMGYVICGLISIMASLPFFMFPKKYPDTDFIQEERIKEIFIQSKTILAKKNVNVKFHIRKLLCQVADLVANVPLLCVTIAISLQNFIATGLVAFFPKYLETQFGFYDSVSSLVSGAVAVPSDGVGMMLGNKTILQFADMVIISVVYSACVRIHAYALKNNGLLD